MIQAATAAMNMEGMLEASGKPIEFRKLDEEGKKVLNKKNPVPAPHHPSYLTMIKGAVLALNEGKGASKPAILKYLAQHYQLGENLPKINSHLCSALKRGTKGGDIEQ
ncbi:linker histone H1 and H5 family protein, partial [Ancylostoma caninum]